MKETIESYPILIPIFFHIIFNILFYLYVISTTAPEEYLKKLFFSFIISLIWSVITIPIYLNVMGV